MDIEPKSVVQTSPATFAEAEKMFIIKYPMASAPAETIAIAASPLIRASFPPQRSKTATIIVTGKMMNMLFVTLRTEAIAKAPNATCERPSPM